MMSPILLRSLLRGLVGQRNSRFVGSLGSTGCAVVDGNESAGGWETRHFPEHVAVLGAAGGLGVGILSVCPARVVARRMF